MRSLILAAVLAVAAACAGCASAIEKAGPVAAKHVNHYCTLPVELRRLNRDTFNAMIAPNAARIDCAGDSAQ